MQIPVKLTQQQWAVVTEELKAAAEAMMEQNPVRAKQIEVVFHLICVELSNE